MRIDDTFGDAFRISEAIGVSFFQFQVCHKEVS